MSNDRFVYVTYIRTTPEQLWEALTKPEFTRKYLIRPLISPPIEVRQTARC